MSTNHVWKSTTLRLNVEDSDCPVCKFLNGDYTTDNLIEVIKIMDANLVSVQKHNIELVYRLTDLNR